MFIISASFGTTSQINFLQAKNVWLHRFATLTTENEILLFSEKIWAFCGIWESVLRHAEEREKPLREND
jgi:hypothetical protein